MAFTPPTKAKSRRTRSPIGDINVTPLVDVMLVLLIIFMVTAPLMTVGVPVNLPQNKAPALNESLEPLTITIQQDGKIFIQETPIELDTLVEKVKAVMASKPDTRIFIRGDKGISYGQIMTVISLLSSSGFGKIALMTEMPKVEMPKTEMPKAAPGAPRPAQP